MAQVVYDHLEGATDVILLPDENDEVVPGVFWGRAELIGTAAYWTTQSQMISKRHRFMSFRLGNTLVEEAAACLIGNYGIPAEVGAAAYYQLKRVGLLSKPSSKEAIYKVLSVPVMTSMGKVKYRFARQKSVFLASALQELYLNPPSEECPILLRKQLLKIKGIGMKTASWIVRNWLASDEVAIIDTHVYRAGLLVGLFSAEDNPVKDYENMEKKFIRFARAIGCKASLLDFVMWSSMRSVNATAWQ